MASLERRSGELAELETADVGPGNGTGSYVQQIFSQAVGGRRPYRLCLLRQHVSGHYARLADRAHAALRPGAAALAGAYLRGVFSRYSGAVASLFSVFRPAIRGGSA